MCHPYKIYEARSVFEARRLFQKCRCFTAASSVTQMPLCGSLAPALQRKDLKDLSLAERKAGGV